jgi:putative transcriptional regulator
MKSYANIRIADTEKLRELMAKKGFTQRGLAKAASISHVTIVNLFKGEPCGPTIARKICETLNADFDDIFFIQSGNFCNQKSVNELPPTGTEG